MQEAFDHLKAALDRHQAYALVCHTRPDGDAIASLLALTRFLAKSGKRAAAYCFDAVPAYLSFLPDVGTIRRERDDFWREAASTVLLDCGDRQMAGLDAEAWNGRELVVIDHHATNASYGTVNVVDAGTSATAEILFKFFEHTGAVIDRHLATLLFTGIYTDTDGFSNLATTPKSLQAAAALLARGANFREITAATLRNKSIAALKLWGRALERLRLDREKGIAVTVIKNEDLAECQAEPADMEGVANLMNHLSDVTMSMVLRELPDGTVKGSLRTTSDAVDVSKIALLLGGGGHAKAAGFTVKGRIVETDKGWKIIE